MIQALKLKQMVEEGLVLYRNIFRKMEKQTSWTEIKKYVCKVTLSMPASAAPPSTSSSSFSSAPAEMAGLTPPHPPLHQPPQYEDNKDEDL